MAKEKHAVYYKLGSNGGVFYDSVTGIHISGNKEVIALEAEPKSKTFVAALRGGHVVRASKDEFEKWEKFQGVPQPEDTNTETGSENTDEVLKETLEGQSIEEILTWAETFGFDEEDMAKAKKKDSKEKLIAFVLKQKTYYKE